MSSRQGDARAARAAWERGTAVLETLRRAPGFQQWIPSFNGAREWAQGEVLDAEGKHGEAEGALRRAIGFYDETLRSADSLEAASRGQVTVDSMHSAREATEL